MLKYCSTAPFAACSLDSIQDSNFNFGFQTSKTSEYPILFGECKDFLDMVQKVKFRSENCFWSSPKNFGIPKMKMDFQNLD